MAGWIGVDLDGTLAHYEGWKAGMTIGKPIPKMVRRVKEWLKQGHEVRIFTARVGGAPGAERERQRSMIETWSKNHLGEKLKVTSCKDFGMIECWDDRAVQVRTNTGEPVDVLRRER